MQNVSLRLNYDLGYRWYSKGNVFVKGWVIDEDGISYVEEALTKYFKRVSNENDFLEVLSKTNGHFAVVINLDDCLLLAVDRGRSLPLYVRFDVKSILVSDSGFSLFDGDIGEKDFDLYSIEEYMAAGHVTGNRTLLKDAQQLGAGEFACITKQNIKFESYFKFLPDIRINGNNDSIKEQLIEILDKDFTGLIRGLNGRAVVVPLSGGYDSRSIVAMFKRHNYKNVICYSFGQKNSPEMITSEKVAKRLGYKWFFIETTPELVKDFVYSDDFLKYVDFAANVSSFYIIQDYFAVKKMRADGMVPIDAVFMPGHSGDTLGGSNFLELFSGEESKGEMIEKLIAHRYDLNRVSAGFIDKIRENLNAQFTENVTPAEWFDYWCMKEWNPKMFANGVRVYEYFGYSYFLPLWSKNLLAFFSNIPFEYRLGKELHEKTWEEELFEPLGINFTPNRRFSYSHRVSFFQRLKNMLKRVLPKQFIYSRISKDYVNSKLYTKEMLTHMRGKGENIRYIGTNPVKVQWYIKHLMYKYSFKSLK